MKTIKLILCAFFILIPLTSFANPDLLNLSEEDLEEIEQVYFIKNHENFVINIEKSVSNNKEALEACENIASETKQQKNAYQILNLDAVPSINGVKCSFDLEWIVGKNRSTTCECKQKFCPAGGQVSGCTANCPAGYTANCDCGSCDGIQTSTCNCW